MSEMEGVLVVQRKGAWSLAHSFIHTYAALDNSTQGFVHEAPRLL